MTERKIAELKLHEMRNVLRYPEDGTMTSLARAMTAYCYRVIRGGYLIHLTIDLRELPDLVPRVADRYLAYGVRAQVHKIIIIDKEGNSSVYKDKERAT
jgi:hypothetical protein